MLLFCFVLQYGALSHVWFLPERLADSICSCILIFKSKILSAESQVPFLIIFPFRGAILLTLRYYKMKYNTLTYSLHAYWTFKVIFWDIQYYYNEFFFFFGSMTTIDVFTTCYPDKARCSSLEICPSFSSWSKARRKTAVSWAGTRGEGQGPSSDYSNKVCLT